MILLFIPNPKYLNEKNYQNNQVPCISHYIIIHSKGYQDESEVLQLLHEGLKGWNDVFNRYPDYAAFIVCQSVKPAKNNRKSLNICIMIQETRIWHLVYQYSYLTRMKSYEFDMQLHPLNYPLAKTMGVPIFPLSRSGEHNIFSYFIKAIQKAQEELEKYVTRMDRKKYFKIFGQGKSTDRHIALWLWGTMQWDVKKVISKGDIFLLNLMEKPISLFDHSRYS